MNRQMNPVIIVAGGLGLPVTKKLVDILNGKITIESEYGKSTTVSVFLPIKVAPLTLIRDKLFKIPNYDYYILHRDQIALDTLKKYLNVMGAEKVHLMEELRIEN